MAITSFRRIESKYIVNSFQKEELTKELLKHMEYDKFCVGEKTYKIQNIYYDTDDQAVISRSIEKPTYKQKLRLRKYDSGELFLEIKKKSEGVVGKRRISLTMEELKRWMEDAVPPVRTKYVDQHIIQEISYYLKCTRFKENVYISYERLGFFDKNDKEFRVTFDSDIHTKRNNFDFDTDDYEENLLPDGTYILEIKSVRNYPIWLVNKLNELKIYRHSFSKYGTEYKRFLSK